MTQLSTYGGVVVPSATDAATIPADLLYLVNQFCGAVGKPARVNEIVASQAERDTNYDGYPAGGIIICPQLKAIWMSLGKTGGVQNWQVIHIDTGWVYSGFGFGSDWTPVSPTSVKARRKANMFTIEVGVFYNGTGDIVANGPTASDPGNIVDQQVLTAVPDFARPDGSVPAMFYGPYTNGASLLVSSGTMNLRTMNTSSRISPSQAIYAQFLWFAGD